MRWLACMASVILLASAACDEKKDDPAASASPSASATATATATAPASADTSPEAGASVADAAPKPPASVAMPQRPVPRPQTMVGSTMPIDVQQRAIAYMVAMRAPHLDDPAVDTVFAEALAKKLKPIVLHMDTGPNKALMNRVEIVASGRQIDLLMSKGCNDKMPLRAILTRAGVALSTLAQHGMLVVRCNDSRIQCLQSTRDADDVLCTTAPRHK